MTDRPRGEDPGDRIGGLYDRLAPGLYRYALMLLADPAGAADAVQQVFVAMLRRPIALDADVHYLRRAVRNECFSALRRRRRDVASSADPPLLEGVAAADDRPEERLVLEQAMRTLSPEQREVLHCKIFEGMTFREIADFCGESINTVASRYRYAIERLRAQLGGQRT